VDKILAYLQIPEDREAMHFEHGIGTLLPFIANYFPQAKIVPIVIDEKHKNISMLYQLADILYQIISQDPTVFLLISVDFSHKAGREQTFERDTRSLQSALKNSYFE